MSGRLSRTSEFQLVSEKKTQYRLAQIICIAIYVLSFIHPDLLTCYYETWSL
jgi:hypothetical protein